MTRARLILLTALLLLLSLPAAAHATAKISSSCFDATVALTPFPNKATTAHIVVVNNGATISDTKRRIASPEPVPFDLTPDANGTTDVTIYFRWLETNRGKQTYHREHTGCAAPTPPPTVTSPPMAPPVTPPVTPPAQPKPPKVCVPSGTSVELHKTGSRSFELTGKARHIRWRFAGEKLPRLNGQKTVVIPGDGTGRVTVRFRANCQRDKRAGTVTQDIPQAAG